MFPFRICQGILLGALLLASPVFAARTHRAATSGHSRTHRHSRHAHVVRGQRQIDSARATQIQNALIREHYLAGPASGQWDATTEAAMQKYQADHGWQTKLTPDSRALIKLGLGPSNDTVQPTTAKSAPPASGPSSAPTSASASGSAVTTLADAHSIQN